MTSVKMNLAMSTKIPHLLDQDGQIPIELNLISFLGEIVTSVSSSRELRCSEPIQCRKYRAKKRCGGSIAAWCKEQNGLSPIEWCCFDCGEGGTIYDWQGSIFDKKDLRLKRVHEHISQGVWLNDFRLDEVQMLLQPQPGHNGLSYLRYPPARIVARQYDEGVIRLTLPSLLLIELFQREILSSRNKMVTLRLGHGDTMRYCSPQVRYPHRCDGPVELEFLPERS